MIWVCRILNFLWHFVSHPLKNWCCRERKTTYSQIPNSRFAPDKKQTPKAKKNNYPLQERCNICAMLRCLGMFFFLGEKNCTHWLVMLIFKLVDVPKPKMAIMGKDLELSPGYCTSISVVSHEVVMIRTGLTLCWIDSKPQHLA